MSDLAHRLAAVKPARHLAQIVLTTLMPVRLDALTVEAKVSGLRRGDAQAARIWPLRERRAKLRGASEDVSVVVGAGR